MRRLKSYWPNVVVAAAAVVSLHGIPPECLAQSSSMFGGRGPTSSIGSSGIRTGGGAASGFGTASPFSSGFGNTSFTGNSGALSGGSSPFGTMQFGTSQMGAAGLARTSGLGNNAYGATSGYGGNQYGASQYGASQYGRSGASQFGRTTGTRFGQSTFGRFSQSGFNRNQSQFSNQNQQQTNQDSGVRIRPQVGFDYDERASNAVNNSIRDQFQRVARGNPDFDGIRFEMNDRSEVLLTGNVPTEHAGRLAAALVRLEPGVRAVYNRTQVAASR